MKILIYKFLKALLICFLLCSCSAQQEENKFNLPDNFNPKKSGYTFMNKKKIVKFIYSPVAYNTTMLPDDKVYVAGTFNGWQKAVGDKNWEMKKEKDGYVIEKPFEELDVKGVSGNPEFKFIKNKNEWQELNQIDEKYKHGKNLWINKDIFRKDEEIAGYKLSDDLKKVTFIFQPEIYGAELEKSDNVYLVGTFNEWAEAINDPKWQLEKTPCGTFVFETEVSKIDVPGESGYPEFKFVASDGKWQQVDVIESKFKRNNNLWVNFDVHGDITPPSPGKAVVTGKSTAIISFSEKLEKRSAENSGNYFLKDGSVQSATLLPNLKDVKLIISPIDIEAKNYMLDNKITITGIIDKNGIEMKRKTTLPLTISRKLLKKFFDSIPATDKKLGSVLEDEKVIFRLFGPRLKGAEVLLYKKFDDEKPFKKLEMKCGENFVWEGSVSKNEAPHGMFYKFLIKKSDKEFLVNDPYTKASIGSAGKSIVIYSGVNDAPFEGWTNEKYSTPDIDKLVIYETHIANLSGKNPAVSNIPHTYLSMTIDAPGSPLDHLKKLGINVVEFLPLHEYQNGSKIDFKKHYHWGYMTSLFFAPESSFSTDAAARKQVSELKKMIDTFHKNGIAVIVDVVYNHTSNADNALGMIDSEYYFTGGNLSGCGNDTYCSRPVMRKLILDSLIYWISEYHIDGFRFDLSHLIDQKNLFTPENILKLKAAKTTKGELILIGTVARWNDYFRNDIKSFISEGKNKKVVLDRVQWSKGKKFYGGPMEVVNYVESHDEETMANLLIGEGYEKEVDIVNRAKMAGIILFTSQGIPMILEGQEVLRDKAVQTQDYDSNVIDWELMKKNSAFLDFYKNLIFLRKKNPVLRMAKDQSAGFYKELKTKNSHAVGYVLNADSSVKDEPKFAVLLNPSVKTATFNLPEGNWKVIADPSGFYEKERKEISGEVKLEGGEFVFGKQ